MAWLRGYRAVLTGSTAVAIPCVGLMARAAIDWASFCRPADAVLSANPVPFVIHTEIPVTKF